MAAEGVGYAKLERSDMSITGEINRWEPGIFLKSNLWRSGRDEPEGGEAMTTWYRGEDIKQDGVLDVERRLGQGGMGCVLFARNKEDGTAVAIKVAKEGSDRAGILSQLREIAVRDRAREHKNLVKALAFDDFAPGCPIFFEACAFDMYYAVIEGNLLNTRECICLTQDAASGLSYLHQNGVVHGDVKLENILLQPDGHGFYTAKITDLGGAMGIGDDRYGGGTYGYTAPEAVFGMCPADPKQDVWALGHMILLMLTKPQCRTSNMFMHSRTLTVGDHELKAKLALYGDEDFATRYITHKNMLALSTLPTLLDMLQDELANQLGVLQLIHLLLRVKPRGRLSMRAAHDKLGLLIDDLQRSMTAGSSKPARFPDSPPPPPEPEPVPAPPQRRPSIARKEPPLAPPPGLVSRSASKNEPDVQLLPPPPPPPPLSPGLDLIAAITASFEPHLPHPAAEGAPTPATVGVSAGVADADNRASSPTSTINGDEAESCHPKADTKSLQVPDSDNAAVSVNAKSGREVLHQVRQVQAPARCGGGGGGGGRPAASSKAAPPREPQGVGRPQFDGRRNNMAAANTRLMTSVFNMGVQGWTSPHGVAPRSSKAAFCGAHEYATAGMGYPHGFGAAQWAGAPNAACYCGPLPSADWGSGSGVAAAATAAAAANYGPTGFMAQGYGLGGRAPSPCFSPATASGWVEQGGGSGGWAGQAAVGCGGAWQGGRVLVYPNRHHAGGIHGHPWQGRGAAARWGQSSRSGVSTTNAAGEWGQPLKGKPRKRRNRAGGRKHPRAGQPEHAGGGGGAQRRHATDLAVPYAMAVNGPMMYYAGVGDFHPRPWSGYRATPTYVLGHRRV